MHDQRDFTVAGCVVVEVVAVVAVVVEVWRLKCGATSSDEASQTWFSFEGRVRCPGFILSFPNSLPTASAE